MFDWCVSNQCDDCKGDYTHWWFERRGRGKKEVIVYGDKVFCDCPCHEGKKKLKKNMPKPKRRKK